MSRFLSVDPGLANTGVVLFENGGITAAWTFRSEGEGRKVDFAKAVARGTHLAHEFAELFKTVGKVDAVVVEGYKDIPGDLRKAANRWTTPLTIGLIYPTLLDFGPVLWQDPEIVMTQYRQHVGMWAAGRTGIVAGDTILQKLGTKNEHTRSAAAHGLYLLTRLKAVGR